MTDVLSPLDRAERALQDSETRLQQVLDNTSAVVFAKDRAGRYLFVNREFEALAGRPSAAIIGRTDEEVFAPDLATRFRHNDLRVLREGRAIEFEEVGDFGEGVRTFLSSKFPLLDAAREAYAVCGIATDITERKRALEALSDSEAQYRAIFNASVDALVLFDSRLRRVDVNPSFERMYGWTREEVVGKGYDEVAAQHSEPDARLELVRRALAGETARREFDAVCKNGDRIRIEMIATPFWHRGEPHALAIARDMTERKRLEDALSSAALAVSESEGEALFRELARYLSAILRVDAVFIATVDPDSPARMQVRAMYLDGRLMENFSYALDGTPCETVVGQQFRFYPSRLLELFPTDTDFRDLGFESYAGHPLTDASERPLGLLAVVCRRPLENPAFVESVLRIFAARVLAEIQRLAAQEALRDSQEHYRAIFNASTDAMILWDSQLRRVDVNLAYERIFGWSREEVLGKGYGCEREYAAPRESMVRRALAGEVCRAELESLRKDGTRIDIEVEALPFRHRGEPHVLAVVRDITEAKRAESQRQALETQLRQAQKMEAIGQLTGGIAHDFNNLLTSIMGYVTLAGERESAQGDRRLSGFLAQAQRSCERARDLIQQMLMFSRGQRGSPKALDLDALVDEALESVRPTLPETLQLESDIDPHCPLVRTDPLQVEQVLLNLCINARDALDGQGSIRVTVRPVAITDQVCSGCRSAIDGSFVELAVQDDGPGISADVQERIFEPFFSTKEHGKGTGMGLAMVHGIVHEHGGHVLVESTPGRGARFRVLWPTLPGAEGTPTAAPRADAATVRPSRPELWGKALVVDDEAAVGEFMRELLESWGLQASYAPSPAAALELVGAEPRRFDVVITDQSMPRMTGLQLATALRQQRPDLPVILYTGYGEGIAPTDLQAAGIRAVIAKPVDPGALHGTLSGLLGRERARPAP